MAEPHDAQHEQDADEGEDRVREAIEPVVVDAAGRPEHRQARRRVGDLPLQEELRVVVLHGRLHGAGRVDHDDAEADERHDGRRENGVDRTRCAGGARLRVERGRELQLDGPADVAQAANHRVPPSPPAGRSDRTARTNSSPRCL